MESRENAGIEVLAAVATAAVAFSKSLLFSFSTKVVDSPGFSAACRQRATAREERVETSNAVLRGEIFEAVFAVVEA
jgi:hypothetical protein